MPRVEIPFANELTAIGEHAPSLDRKTQLLDMVREHSADMSRQIDRYLLESVARFRTGLVEVQEEQKKLREILERLGAVPWHRAIYLGRVDTEAGPRVEVQHGSTRRVVGLAANLEPDSLRIGDEVFLGNELNVVMLRAPDRDGSGETAAFERWLDEGRLVLRSRDTEVVVRAAAAFGEEEVKPGDLVRWDRPSRLAHEKLPRVESRRFFLEEAPDVGRDQVGGLDESLHRLLSALKVTLLSPEKAAAYGLGSRNSVFLWGPPGCGKTLMARVVAAEIAKETGQTCRFGVVKPAEWEDPYVGVTQQNIRRTFRACREAARDGLVVLFLDEIEAIGRLRGHAFSPHADKFLNAFLCEIDGFEGRDGIALVAASNRKDLIDPALLERLTDVEIEVRRPGLDAARRILEIHLPESVPYRENGASDGRREAIERTASLLYGPNADNDLCELRFRDGRTRTVAAREVVSGRLLEQICRDARRSAFLRDLDGGEPGVGIEDAREAVAQTLARLRTTLTRANAHAYLADLPQDVDIVAVEPIRPRVANSHRFLNVA